MTTEQNKTAMRRWLEGWNTGSASSMEALADELLTPDFVGHGFGPTLSDVKQFVRMAHPNTPSTLVTIEEMIAEGEKVATRFTVHGMDASSGKPAETLLMAICHFAGGKIAEAWQIDVLASKASSVIAASEVYDPQAVVQAFDAAFNAGDIERVMAFFTDDSVVKDPTEPKVYTGKQQIRDWFQPLLQHVQVVSTNHHVVSSTVIWNGTLTGDIVKQMGSSSIEESAESVVQDGKITSLALTIVSRKP